MRFYDRESELKALEKALEGPISEMAVITGRRRIGKSRLVEEFLKSRNSARLMIVPKEEKLIAGDFANALADEFRPQFQTVAEALEYFFLKSSKQILFIDEFPNLVEANRNIPYEVQKLWEKYRSSTRKLLIFTGSYVSMMDKIFTRKKAPLFNRAGCSIILQQLDIPTVWKIQKDLNVNKNDFIRNYCIFCMHNISFVNCIKFYQLSYEIYLHV